MKLQSDVNPALLPEPRLTGERARRFCARTKGTVTNQLRAFSVAVVSVKHRGNTAGLVLLLTARRWKALMPGACLSLAVAAEFRRCKAGWEQSRAEYTRVMVWYIRSCSWAVNSLQRDRSWLFTTHEAGANQLHVGDISGGFREGEHTPRLWHNCFTSVQVVQ